MLDFRIARGGDGAQQRRLAGAVGAQQGDAALDGVLALVEVGVS